MAVCVFQLHYLICFILGTKVTVMFPMDPKGVFLMGHGQGHTRLSCFCISDYPALSDSSYLLSKDYCDI